MLQLEGTCFEGVAGFLVCLYTFAIPVPGLCKPFKSETVPELVGAVRHRGGSTWKWWNRQVGVFDGWNQRRGIYSNLWASYCIATGSVDCMQLKDNEASN